MSDDVAAQVEALLADLGEGELDSFRLIELVEAVEQRFGLRVRAHEATQENFGTKQQLVAYLRARLGPGA